MSGDKIRTDHSPAAVILCAAADIVDGDRQQTHGPKELSFTMAAQFWSIWLGHEVSASDVAECMSLLKKARRRCGLPVTDHYVDDAGYTAIAGELTLGGNDGEHVYE